jgi:GT2 family glycosyltransferase
LNTAIVILNYNGRHWLEQFLPSVIQHSTGARIIVADNCSTDDSVQFVNNHFREVEVLLIPSNLGFCGGYNFALKQVKEDYYVLLNSDVEVTAGWLEPIIHLLNTDASVAAAQPKILSYADKTVFEYAGAAGGFIDTLGYPFCRGRIFTDFEKDEGQYNDTVPVFWATGACLFIRASRYHEMGGLDEDFFAHMEEIDLCWRLHRAGYRIYYEGRSTVYHVGGGTLAASNPRKTYFNFRNGLSLIYKNMETSELLWKLPVRLVLDHIAALRFLVSGSVADFKAVWKAHWHFLKRIGREQSKRKTVASSLRSYQVNPIYKGVLIVDFFLRGKKTFRDLKF